MVNCLSVIKGYDNEYCILILGYNGKGKEVVIEEIQFINRKKGNMTKHYNILKGLQCKYKTGKIRIESVLTNEMKNWCIKNGFEYYNGSYYQPNAE